MALGCCSRHQHSPRPPLLHSQRAHIPAHTPTCAHAVLLSLLHITYTDQVPISQHTQSPRYARTEAQTHLRKRDFKGFSLEEARRTKPGI